MLCWGSPYSSSKGFQIWRAPRPKMESTYPTRSHVLGTSSTPNWTPNGLSIRQNFRKSGQSSSSKFLWNRSNCAANSRTPCMTIWIGKPFKLSGGPLPKWLNRQKCRTSSGKKKSQKCVKKQAKNSMCPGLSAYLRKKTANSLCMLISRHLWPNRMKKCETLVNTLKHYLKLWKETWKSRPFWIVKFFKKRWKQWKRLIQPSKSPS